MLSKIRWSICATSAPTMPAPWGELTKTTIHKNSSVCVHLYIIILTSAFKHLEGFPQGVQLTPHYRVGKPDPTGIDIWGKSSPGRPGQDYTRNAFQNWTCPQAKPWGYFLPAAPLHAPARIKITLSGTGRKESCFPGSSYSRDAVSPRRGGDPRPPCSKHSPACHATRYTAPAMPPPPTRLLNSPPVRRRTVPSFRWMQERLFASFGASFFSRRVLKNSRLSKLLFL